MMFVLLLALIQAPPSVKPAAAVSDPALAYRIERLFHTVFSSDNDAQEAPAISEVKAIYTHHGLPTIAEVGDEAAYEFVLLLASDKFPFAFRNHVLPKVQEAAARQELAPDAFTFYAARLGMAEARRKAENSPPANPALRDEIERMYQSDQAVRQRRGFDAKKMEETDRRHTSLLQNILDNYGLPTYSLVGPDAADEFVTMIQHQPAAFRQRILPQLQAQAKAGQADPASYALVYDRAQRDMGKKQLYGTQFECKAGKKWHLAPTEDEAHVNQRRAELGHMRVELYGRILAQMMPQFCPPAEAKAGKKDE